VWKRVQKERKGIGCRIIGPLEKRICKTLSYKVSERECDEETDCVMECLLVEFKGRRRKEKPKAPLLQKT
jgi:hypothetical protein